MVVRLALQNDLPLIGHVNAGKHLDQRALATPVLPRKAVDLRGMNRELTSCKARTPPKRLLMPRISMNGVSPFAIRGVPSPCCRGLFDPSVMG